ncbi:formate/nitrite transporter [Rhodoblastus acidophilus]|uniref:formate/nitrite transporter family protein n=1 Tax=Rhodoblastus acidophilus TaxID=1074 RepID=UPI002224CF22|nr:formate/nitrite transporter family protein [Rhodoblastus acidophilus]MCW2285402.1 formate/nitrite transporter [Rhodoblastus acidophilus]MCW2334349.1 formate/nitrite transporter [Rhodoblastus acidophilus]
MAEMFGSDAYSPAEIQDKVEKLGVKKAHMPFLPEFVLAIVAGGSIGLGGMFFCIVLGDPTLGYATQRVVGGLMFSLGLALVMIAGAELFTGNCLLTMAWANRQISTYEVIKNWMTVWFGNLVGALGLVFLLWMCHFPDLNGGNVGLGMLKLAVSKVSPDGVTIFFKGIMCNILVCLGVWLAYAGRSVSDKMLGMILPVAAFVAAGFEHCIANMMFLPMAWLMVITGHVPAGFDASAITPQAILHNLEFATLGNIVGGGVFVGAVYWLIYRKGLGGLTPLHPAAPKPSSSVVPAE